MNNVHSYTAFHPPENEGLNRNRSTSGGNPSFLAQQKLVSGTDAVQSVTAGALAWLPLRQSAFQFTQRETVTVNLPVCLVLKLI